jgi:hypothetical protein
MALFINSPYLKDLDLKVLSLNGLMLFLGIEVVDITFVVIDPRFAQVPAIHL